MYDQYLPYLCAVSLALPLLYFFRLFVFSYIKFKNAELKILTSKSGVGNKLLAYERMTLFLERIKPANLVTRFDKTLAPHEHLFLLEKSINEEFDYNASLQLYISKSTWQNIVISKSNILQIAYKSYESLGANATLEDYKTVFLINYMDGEDFISNTLDEMRREVSAIA